MTSQSLDEQIGCNSPKIHLKKLLRLGVPKKISPNSCSCTPIFFLFVPSSLFFWKNLVVIRHFPNFEHRHRHCTPGVPRTFWMSSYITGSEPSNFRQRWTFMGFSSSSDSARTWRCVSWTQTEPNRNRRGFEVVWKGRPSWRVVWHTVIMIVSEWLWEPCVFLL